METLRTWISNIPNCRTIADFLIITNVVIRRRKIMVSFSSYYYYFSLQNSHPLHTSVRSCKPFLVCCHFIILFLRSSSSTTQVGSTLSTLIYFFRCGVVIQTTCTRYKTIQGEYGNNNEHMYCIRVRFDTDTV